MPNKLSRFWQELKRRKVIHVITVYAGAAFVIIELVSNITEPLTLPEWTPTLVIILLAIGFPIVIIVSWIYDVHPEGGIVKTEPADKVKTEEIPKSSNSWKIASYISFVVIVGLIVLNVIPRTKNKEILDKSIAVLPFLNDSPDQEMYFINGVMEEILDNLCKIEDLRVVSRSSVEQYRDKLKPIPVVAGELDVCYVLEGSGQRDGDNIRLTVQLLDARKDQHLWSESYYREIKDIFELQSEIAQLVAKELKAVITPEEIQIIEKTPTTNLTALDYYQRGREEYISYQLDNTNRTSLSNAILHYRSAIAIDPGYAKAYTGLALALWDSFWRETKLKVTFSEAEYRVLCDTVIAMVNKALEYDKDLEEAYLVRGLYYSSIREYNKADKEFDKSLRINPNYSWGYNCKADLQFSYLHSAVEGIKNKLKAIELERGTQLPQLLRELGWYYDMTGFFDKASGLFDQMFQLNKDTIMYYQYMSDLSFEEGDWQEYMNWSYRMLEIDPDTWWPNETLAWTYCLLGNIDTASYYLNRAFKLKEEMDLSLAGEMEILQAYIYWETGQKDMANNLFDKLIEYYEELLRTKPFSLTVSSYQEDYIYLMYLAEIYAVKGQHEKALDYLNRIDLISFKPYGLYMQLHESPFFKEIRTDPRFLSICNAMKTVWQAEHERIQQWLEENDML